MVIHTCDDHHSLAWPLLIRAAVYGVPLAGCAVVAWLAWRMLRREGSR